MNWQELIVEVIIELGGFSVIVITGLKYIGKTFEYKISKQYEAKLNEKLELYKRTIENMSYVNKAKFDANFAVCCEISEKLISCLDAISTITPVDGDGIEQTMEIGDINEIINELKKCINRNMPIISKELYNKLSEWIGLFCNQVIAFQILISDEENEDINLISQKELDIVREEAYDLLRKYYNSLCVILN